jgi:hypothetical protein
MGIDILSNFRDINLSEYPLTPRMQKGFNFEKLVWEKLKDFGFDWGWLKGLGKGEGVDFYHRKYRIEVEAKFSHSKKIYSSWVRRDIVERFSEDAKYKIVTTNRGYGLTEEGKRMLKEKDIFHIPYESLKNAISLLIFIIEHGVNDTRNKLYNYIVHSTNVYCTRKIRNSTYYDITYKKRRLKTRLRHDLFQTSLASYPDDSLKLVAYILGITNLFHTIKHTCLNDLALSIKRISSSMPLNMRLRDTYTRLIPIHRLISFTLSPFRIPFHEPFSMPYDYSKETLPKPLYDTLKSSTVLFSHTLTPDTDIELRSIHYPSARSDQLDLHGMLEESLSVSLNLRLRVS